MCTYFFFLSHIQFVASRRAKMNEWSVGFRKLGTCASFLIFFSPWLFFFLPQDRLHSGDHPRGIIKNPTTKPTVKFISTVAVRSINEFFFLHFFFFFLSLLCNLVSCFFFSLHLAFFTRWLMSQSQTSSFRYSEREKIIFLIK